MAVTHGFKQTEVGLIPNDWNVEPLRALGEVVRGASPRPKGDKRFYGGNIRRLMVEDITRDKHWITPSIDFLTNEGAKQSRLCCAGTLTVVCSGTPTAVGLPALLAVDACIHDGILALKHLNKNVSADFLFYQLSALQTSLHAAATHGGTFVNLTTDGFGSFKVALPPTKAEQEAIAQALNDADALLESLEQLLAKKRDLKQGVMQDLLTGKKRLPGFSGEREVRTLGQIAHIKTGSRNNQDKVDDGEYPLFVRSVTVERINSYSYDCEAILVPGEGGIGNIFHYINGRFDVHQRVYAITQFRPDAFGKFVYFYMARNFGAHAMRNSVKATVDSLRLPTFLNFEIVMPPTIEEQTAIAAILSDMDSEITALEAQTAKAQNLKRGMMQELLAGRIRLV